MMSPKDEYGGGSAVPSNDDDEHQDPYDDPEEQQVIYRAINSFHRYRDQAHYHITHKRRQAFYALPQAHWSMLSNPPFNMLDTFDRIDEAIEKNAELADAMVQTAIAMYDIDEYQNDLGAHDFSSRRAVWEGPLNAIDQDKAHSTIKQLYRDWSAEGAIERAACFGPVVKALDDEFQSIPREKRGDIQVLVPGAGLGRSVFEICRAGYAVEGNEISYHQVIASAFMLNFTQHAGQFELYPWIHGFSNHLNRQDQLQMVRIPDVHPGAELMKASEESEISVGERMGFASADFCVAYKDPDAAGRFNAVASIFFIDTAPNIIKYVEAVHNCLKTGGIWINLGPLKWHFENDPPGGKDNADSSDKGSSTKTHASNKVSIDNGIGEPGSVELTEDEVMNLLDVLGFDFEKHETKNISTGYIGNPRSMWESVYHPSFWVARKR